MYMVLRRGCGTECIDRDASTKRRVKWRVNHVMSLSPALGRDWTTTPHSCKVHDTLRTEARRTGSHGLVGSTAGW
jgi:hypothetical protein